MWHINNLTASVCMGNLFRRPPTLRFAPEIERCVRCDGELEAHKSQPSTLISLDMGKTRVWETILRCPRCDVNYGSDELRRLKPPKAKFGYDVLVHVGKAQYCSPKDIDVISRLSVGGVLGPSMANRPFAHLAFDASRVASAPTRDDPLLQYLVKNDLIQHFHLRRGKRRRMSPLSAV